MVNPLHPVLPTVSHSQEQSSNSRFRFTRFLYTQNPFYLLSVCFVLHGTGLQMNGSHEQHEPLPLFLLICGYILMMSLTAVTVIRKARLWEDARSILLLVPVLLVELSLTLDDPLITDPVLGRMLVVGAFLFSVTVFEILLHGLKLKLPRLYRLPLHALMGLIILYPLFIIPAIHHPDSTLSVPWRNYLFGPIAAAAILALIPAIRRGAEYVRENGTPWSWPLYPWTIFVFLILAVGARGYSFTLSFDPVLEQSFHQAMALESTWGWYFLAPILMSVAFLIMEFGIVTKRAGVSFCSMLIPLGTCWMVFTEGNQSLPYHQFLAEFTAVLPSPLFLTLCAATGFYFLALMRHQPLGVPLFVTSLLAFSIIGTDTIDDATLTKFQPLPLMLAGTVLIAKAVFEGRSVRFVLGCLMVTVWFCTAMEPYWDHLWLGLILFHGSVLTFLIAGVFFRDQAAPDFLALGGIGLAIGGGVALLVPMDLPHAVPEWSPLLYSLSLAVIAFAISYPMRARIFFYLGSLLFIGTAFVGGQIVLEQLQLMFRFRGLGSMIVGFLLLILAMLVSAAKAGFLKRWQVLLPKPPG